MKLIASVLKRSGFYNAFIYSNHLKAFGAILKSFDETHCFIFVFSSPEAEEKGKQDAKTENNFHERADSQTRAGVPPK